MRISMTKAKTPPVPSAGRTKKGPGAAPGAPSKADLDATEHHPEKRNLSEQGRQGNIRQNTRNQGYQQDR
jgi:hypothetical protein